MKETLLLFAALSGFATAAVAQTPSSQNSSTVTQETVDKLLAVIAAHEARIRDLEKRLSAGSPSVPIADPPAPAPVQAAVAEQPATHDHSMSLPGGGPDLQIRGFADFNLGVGTDANALIFPLGATPHTTFQAGEFDLYITSKLSPTLTALAELVIGSDHTNTWGLDIERLQLTYKPSDYFQISGGRFHTSIGYYNTTFHHGTWFQTATGRPFMYYFEDSGGILPVHGVGITSSGLIPKTGKLNLRWTAEVMNGRSPDPNAAQVSNFLDDKNGKAVNVAVASRPDWVPGLQVGGSFYVSHVYPATIPRVTQYISSGYAVYTNAQWEFLNEAVLMNNQVAHSDLSYHTPLMYTQVSRAFGKYRPYFRYQYVNVPTADPISIFNGRYQGPSFGLRMDFATYMALKVQYNHLDQRMVPGSNGLDFQTAFTF